MTTPLAFVANAASAPWQVPFKFSMGYPRDGDVATNVRPTRPGPYWFQQVATEIINVIEAAGLTFNPSDPTQFLEAIRILTGQSVAFNVSATGGAHPLTVTFTDASQPAATTRNWNYGDGYADTTGVHTYTAPGSYWVRYNPIVAGVEFQCSILIVVT